MKLLSLVCRVSVGFSCWVSVSLVVAADIQVPEKRIALVIGNAKYIDEPLRNPVNDARLLRTTLTSLGFEVIERTDLDAEGMKAALQDFGARLRATPGSVGMFYFAGHGVQFKGVNYLLPIGRGYSSEADVETAAINADAVLRRIADSGSKIAFVVLDACRNNPFPRVASRGLGTLIGLARMDAPSGTLIAYSTAMGSVASDGLGSNGLYTQHLVNNMKVPGITAEQMFKRTREGVERESGNLQSPREESSLKGADFLFLPASEGKKVNPYLVELTYWESIRSSQDSGDFEAYLRDYPKGKFASLAKQAQDRLQRAARSDPGLGKLGVAHAAVQRGDLVKGEPVFQQLAAAASNTDKARGKEGLAELALLQGNHERADALADEALRLRPKSTAALLIKAKVAHAKGARDDAERLLVTATGTDGVADFPWQKAKAMVASGNLKRKEKPEAAGAAYEAALRIDTGNLEAMTNLVTVLRESGNPQKALDVLKQAKEVSASGSDRVLDALAYQIQLDLSERRDMDRQKLVDESVRELVVRFKEQKALPPPANQDKWTTSPIAISVLGFQDFAESLGGRVGMDVLLGQELGRELKARNVLVVDRTLIDKVLAELKLGASSLADPETQLRLGRLTAARLIAVGRIFKMNGKDYVSFRLIDTETSQVVVNRTEEAGALLDPIAMSARLSQIAAAEVQGKYPVKGRLVSIESDGIIINLGKKNGLTTGDVFKVLGEGKPIEFNGKLLGAREIPLGSLRIASVEDQIAFAVPVEKAGEWEPNLRIVQARQGTQ